MSVGKANKFISTARENGWDTKYKILSADDAYIEVTATRPNEKVVISWVRNQLNGPPIYSLHDMVLKLHSTKVATQTITASKPDMERYVKWQRRQRNSAANGSRETNPEVDVSQYSLPFDVDEDPDSVILKAIRGNTIVYKNSMTGLVETAHVPWRISDGKGGVRVFNHDTTNVFYLAVGETTERAYVSFMDANGQFRAVHLDRLIGVT